MSKRRIIRWLAGFGGLCVILLFAAAFLLPRILDSQAVRDKIRAFLLARTNGNVAFENIDLKWFPRPTVIVRRASFSVDDKVSGKIESIEVYPSIRGLLTGQWDIARVEMASPALSVRVPEPGEEPFNFDDIEGQIRSLLASMAAQIPGMILSVRGGSAEIKIGERPPVAITGLDGRLVAPPGELDLQFGSRADVFDSLRVQGRINGETLATKGQINVENLRLQESLASLVPSLHGYVKSGTLNMNLSLTSVGLKNIKVEIDGDVPSLELMRGNRSAAIEGGTLKGTVNRDDGIVNTVIERLDLVSPRLTTTGELTVGSGSPSQLKLVGKEIKVVEVRDWTLKIAGDVGVVDDIFRHLKTGAIPEISVQSTGRSLAEMWKNIGVSGTLRGANILTYALDIDLEDVSGLFVVSGGVIEGRQLSARLGKIQGTDGSIRLGLEGESAPFHLDVMVQSDAAELHSLLARVINDEGFQKQLSRLRNVTGDLSGRLILGERIDSLSANVSVLKAAVEGSYDSIPYPIAIKAGRFEYGGGKIALDGVSGAVGHSSFSDVTGFLNYQGARQIEISSAKFALDLAQSKNLLNHFAMLREELREIDFARGNVDVTSLSLNGPLDEPSRWNFNSTGTLGKIAVKHAKLPGVMNLSGGKFNATPAKFTVSNAKADLLDASLTVDGSLESPDKAPLSLDATGSGAIGAQMTEWISRQIDWPKQLMLRSPLQVSKGRVIWQDGGDVAFQGSVTVAGGPQLSVDLVQGFQTLEAKQITITDGRQNARMTLDLKKDYFAFSFNGSLDQQTLNRIFQVPPLEGSLIQGDIEVSAFLEAPLRFNARGRLSGRGLRVSLKDQPAVVEFFFLEANQGGLNVRSAELSWRNSRLSVMGTLLAEAKALRLDMNIAADRLVLGELSDLVNRGGKAGGNNEGILGMALPPLEGTVRLKADDFTFARFSLTPLQATASLSSLGIKGTIEKGDVCGIGAIGSVDFTNRELGLDLSFSVTDGQLESTSLCLSENKLAVSGGYSLTAQVTGRGAPEKILQSLRGQFDFSARDGQLQPSPNLDTALESTFNYLNEKGDFNVAFPDLDKESLPFRSLRIHGTVQGMTLANDQLVLQSSLYLISGDGKIDLEHQQIDAKGLITVRVPGQRIIGRIPILGPILGLGGSLLGIPVRVVGPLARPTVTYLSPTDVGSELLRLPVRILGLPLEAIRLFTPNIRE
jgi:AsmA-like C-terminal region